MLDILMRRRTAYAVTVRHVLIASLEAFHNFVPLDLGRLPCLNSTAVTSECGIIRFGPERRPWETWRPAGRARINGGLFAIWVSSLDPML